jgi:hypothetical protein
MRLLNYLALRKKQAKRVEKVLNGLHLWAMLWNLA